MNVSMNELMNDRLNYVEVCVVKVRKLVKAIDVPFPYSIVQYELC